MALIKYLERKASGKIVKELEGLRFLAIVPVVIQHGLERWERNLYIPGQSSLADALMYYFLNGGVGVYLFYAISGFILPLPFATKILAGEPSGSLKKYFLRRLTRLEPPFILVMLFLAISALALDRMETGKVWEYFFSGITYSTVLIYHHFNPINPVIWSLEVEIQFYILAPFLTYFIFKIPGFLRRGLVIVGLIILAIVLQDKTGISEGTNYLRFTVLGQIHYFLVGIFMANLYLAKKLQPSGQTKGWDIIGPLAFFAMLAFGWIIGINKTLLFTCTVALLFFAGFRANLFNRFLRNPWIMAIGSMCYSIYLIHLAVAQGSVELLMNYTNQPQYGFWWFAAYFLFYILSLAIMIPFFYVFIEKPCMDHSWPSKLANFFRTKTRSLSGQKKETRKEVSESQ